MLAVVSGVPVGVILMTANGAGKPAATAELLGYPQRPYEQLAAAPLSDRPAVLGPKAASYVRRWSEKAEVAAMSPKAQLLALKAQGVPVIFPSKVTDESGNLAKMVCPRLSSALMLPACAKCTTRAEVFIATGFCRYVTSVRLHSTSRRPWRPCKSLPSTSCQPPSPQNLHASVPRASPWLASRRCAQTVNARRHWMTKASRRRTCS